jgi:hypothetical protein
MGKDKDKAGKVEKLFQDWAQAEAKYAAAIKAFFADGHPEKVTKASALELAQLRTKADSTMDRFFKKALS